MIRLILPALAALSLSACLNWQGTYDSAARRECYKIIDANDRQDCLTAVEQNASGNR